MKVYLCGPINGCTDREANDWRQFVKRSLTDTLDPMRRDFRGHEDENVEEIVEGDLEDIKRADILLVNAPRPSWGTAMEIREAFLQDKPIIVVIPLGPNISPWLRYHSTKIYHSFEDAIKWIEDHE